MAAPGTLNPQPASKNAAQAGTNTTNETGTRKRRAPTGPKVSKLIVLYESEGAVTFHGIYRGSSSEALEAMSKFNEQGKRVQSKVFEITSKPSKTNADDDEV